jgi:hypothetical protein
MLPFGTTREAEQAPPGNGRQGGEFAGLLPAIRLGRRWYVPRRALEAQVICALEQAQEALARQGERR